ncbi:hypothetical protein DRP53_07260 [candidate division WOR-3 bacterium]|uniref:VWFA domain-containing protein n=1 Tax=candidate division WOR-3 bacterium TaxID=2052148 RepID=A0A660SI91_UNCW3|nr:MAG: hypothetical protein DRP53_07260 [candidate division WOR-3 bacterium]
MKARFILSLLLLSLPLSAKTIFFVVDISASMKRGFLFDRVRDSLIAYIGRYTEIGDRVIVVGFGSDVRIHEEAMIRSSTDRIRLITKLHRIEAQDRFTWMTKAFALVGSKLRALNRTEPKSLKEIYILTDGINEPPPDKEDSLSFDEILKKYVGEYRRRNVFTYYISFGVEPPAEIKRFLKELSIKPVVKARKEIPIFQPSVKLEFPDTVTITKKRIALICIRVKEILKGEGKRLRFRILSQPDDIGVKIHPAIIEIGALGTVDTIQLLTNVIRNFKFRIGIEPEDTTLFVEPTTAEITVKITPHRRTAFLWPILGVILIIILYFIIRRTPKVDRPS